MKYPVCPRCDGTQTVKSGVVGERQRYKCKKCQYYFTVNKIGKQIDSYYVVKALQLYIEGVSLREIERLLGVSHVSVMNWVKKYHIKAPESRGYHPTYQILSHDELQEFFKNKENIANSGLIINELGDKYMIIKWERFKG